MHRTTEGNSFFLLQCFAVCGFWNEFTRRFDGDATIPHQKSIVFVLLLFSTFLAGLPLPTTDSVPGAAVVDSADTYLSRRSIWSAPARTRLPRRHPDATANKPPHRTRPPRNQKPEATPAEEQLDACSAPMRILLDADLADLRRIFALRPPGAAARRCASTCYRA